MQLIGGAKGDVPERLVLLLQALADLIKSFDRRIPEGVLGV